MSGLFSYHISRRKFSLISCTGILLLLFCISPKNINAQYFGYSMQGNAKTVTFPFELKNNLIVVPVILNDFIPLKFILDTGVKTSILTEKGFTDLLDVEYSRKISMAGVNITRVVEAYVAGGMKFTFPGVSAKNQLLLVLQEDYLRLRNTLGAEVHGLMGHDLFSRFVVEIDYANQMITLHEPSIYKKPKGRFQRIPIEIIDAKPYIFAQVKQEDESKVKVKLLVDTGASLGVMLDRNTESDILVPSKTIEANLGRGLTGDLFGSVGRVQSLEIMDFVFRDVVASFPEELEYPEDMERGNRNGILGADILNRFHVVFDYHSQSMYLKKNKAFKKPFNYNMSGLNIIADGPDLKKFMVETVRPNSPAADIGLQRGDIVLKLNGKRSQNLRLNDFFNAFNRKEGRKVRMKIYREGYQLKKTFKLRNDI